MSVRRGVRSLPAPEEDGARRRAWTWPLRAYFVVLVVVFVAAAASAAAYVAIQVDHDARRSAQRDASFAAGIAEKQLAAFVGSMRSTVAGLAGNAQIASIFAHPKGCTLAFSGLTGPDKGHLDIVRSD